MGVTILPNLSMDLHLATIAWSLLFTWIKRHKQGEMRHEGIWTLVGGYHYPNLTIKPRPHWLWYFKWNVNIKVYEDDLKCKGNFELPFSMASCISPIKQVMRSCINPKGNVHRNLMKCKVSIIYHAFSMWNYECWYILSQGILTYLIKWTREN